MSDYTTTRTGNEITITCPGGTVIRKTAYQITCTINRETRTIEVHACDYAPDRAVADGVYGAYQICAGGRTWRDFLTFWRQADGTWKLAGTTWHLRKTAHLIGWWQDTANRSQHNSAF